MNPENTRPEYTMQPTATPTQASSRRAILSIIALTFAILVQTTLILLLKPYKYGLTAWFGYGIVGIFFGVISGALSAGSLIRKENPKWIAILALIMSALPIILGVLGTLYAIFMIIVFTIAG